MQRRTEPGDSGNDNTFPGVSDRGTEQCSCQNNRTLNSPCNAGLEYPFNRINIAQLALLPGCYSQSINNSCRDKFYEELPNMKRGKVYKNVMTRPLPCPMADHGWIVPSGTCGPWCKCGIIPDSALFPDSFEPYLPTMGKGRLERRQVRRKLHHPKCTLAEKEETEVVCVPTNICYFRGTGRNVCLDGRVRFPRFPEPKLDKPGVKIQTSNQSSVQTGSNDTGEFCMGCANTKQSACSSCPLAKGGPSQEQKRGEEQSKRKDESWINKEDHDKCPCQTCGKSNNQNNYTDDNEISYPNEDDTSLCQFCLENSKHKDKEPSNQNTYQMSTCKTCDMSNRMENSSSMRYSEGASRAPGTLLELVDNGNDYMFLGGSEEEAEQCSCQNNRTLNLPCNAGLEYPFNRINTAQLALLPSCYSQSINNSCRDKFYEELPNMNRGTICRASVAHHRSIVYPMADHCWILPLGRCTDPWCKCGIIPDSALFPDSFEPYLPTMGKGRLERRQVRRKLHHPKCMLAEKEETEVVCVPTNICYYRGTGRNVCLDGRVRFPRSPEPKPDKPGVKIQTSNQSSVQTGSNDTGEFCMGCANTKQSACSFCPLANGGPSQEQRRGEEQSIWKDESWINNEDHDKCPCQTCGKSNNQNNYIDDNEISYPNEDDMSLCQFCLENSKYIEREPSNQNTYQMSTCRTCDMSNRTENFCSAKFREGASCAPGTLLGGCQAKPQVNTSMRSCLSAMPRNLLYQCNRAHARTIVYEE